MGYTIGMSSLDKKPINIQKLKEFCLLNPTFKLDDTKTWTNMYDQVVLYKANEKWEMVCAFDNDDNYAISMPPNDDLFDMSCKIADDLGLFIFGEENEIYYIPTYGKPQNHIDFEIAKSVFAENGFDINLIIEKATVEH